MKPLLLFLIIYNVHVIVHSHNHEKESLLFKSLPKKVHQSQMLNAKLINSARFIKTAPPMMKSKKKTNSDTGYTVFPKVSTVIPDSPYFPLDFDFFHKHRERKLLPRNKRSVPGPNNPAPAKVAKVTETGKPPANPADNKLKSNDKPKENKPKDSKPKDETKVAKPKPSDVPKKGILKQENKSSPKPVKVAKPAAKGKPVSRAGKKRKSRRVLPKGKSTSHPNKGGKLRKISRQGGKPLRSLRNGTKVKSPGKSGQKGKRQLRHRKRSRKNSGKDAKPPHVPQKGNSTTF